MLGCRARRLGSAARLQSAEFPRCPDLADARQLLAGAALMPVAIVDSGITVHTALPPGQILPGYNFYTFDGSARSSDYYDSGD
jgi:hypothetical protein